MAPVPVPRANTITHFTHPGHQLYLLNIAAEYNCDGCKTNGAGVRFHCQPCDFDLHEYCATCPPVLSSFMHTHPLNLVLRKPQATCSIQRICDVCRQDITGLFYRCKGCDFDVHPLCTQLSSTLHHPLHPPHPLTFLTSSFGWCAVCLLTCDSWRYRCAPCGFDIHLGCILRAAAPLPPAYGAAGFHGQSPAYGAGIHVPPAAYGSGPGAYGNQFNRGDESNGNGGKTSMYALVGKLALGVLNNVDLSSFIM